MRRFAVFLLLAVFALTMSAFAVDEGGFDMDRQLDALGRDELTSRVPEDARQLMEQAGVDELSVEELLQLSPKDFFSTVWQIFVRQIKKPIRTLGVIAAVVIMCSMLNGLNTALSESAMSQMFTTVAALCILTSVITPILDCIIQTSAVIQGASVFMLTFVPVFTAAMTAAGQPASGAAYNLFLFSTCQVVSQVMAQTLIPLMSIYLAICVIGALVPEMKIASAAASIKSVVSWILGLLVTVFVGLLSIQTMVSGGVDSVTARTAKFLIGSFVPVVGSALSEALSAARGCLRLIKTTVGAYGILAAAFIFLPVLLQAMIWYFVTGAAVVAGNILGADKVAAVMKSCSSVLGILIAAILCFALLIIVSTTVVMVAGTGSG